MSWTHCDTCGQPWQGHTTACKLSVGDYNQHVGKYPEPPHVPCLSCANLRTRLAAVEQERDTLKAENASLCRSIQDGVDGIAALRSHLRAALECVEGAPEPQRMHWRDVPIDGKYARWHTGPRTEMVQKLNEVLK